MNQVKTKLVDRGLTFLEKVNVPNAGQITLFTASQLGSAKRLTNLLRTLYWLLPLLALICFAGAILISRDRRKALMRSGIGLAIAMAVVLIALGVTRLLLLGQMKNPANKSAATAIWNQLLHGLKAADGGLLALGLIVGVACAIYGPSDWAVSLRGRTAGMFKNARERRRHGEAPVGPVGRFVAAHTWGMRIGGLAVALIILIFSPLLFWLLIIILIVLIVYLGVLELLR